MTRTSTIVCALTAVVSLTAGGLTAASAAVGEASPAFATVRTTAFDAQSVAAPGPGEVIVAGVQHAVGGLEPGQVAVDVLVDGAWTTQAVPATAQHAQVFSSAGQTWLLASGGTTQAGQAGSWSLWRREGGGWTQLPSPAIAAEFVPESATADGATVHLWGNSTSGTAARDMLLTLSDGIWSVRRPHSQTPDQPSSAAPRGEVVVKDGHVLAETAFAPGSWQERAAVDYSTAQPTVVQPTRYGSAPLGSAMVEAAHLAVEDPSTVYAWGVFHGPAYNGRASQTGACTHGSASCPAVTWRISSVLRLGDGRQVVGGADDWNTKDLLTGAVLTTTEGGYAMVPSPGAQPVPLAGDPGQEVRDLAASPDDSVVWSVTRVDQDQTQVQSASLSSGPAPTPAPPTSTPTPSPTASPTPTPCPTKTKKPRRPRWPHL